MGGEDREEGMGRQGKRRQGRDAPNW